MLAYTRVHWHTYKHAHTPYVNMNMHTLDTDTGVKRMDKHGTQGKFMDREGEEETRGGGKCTVGVWVTRG